MTGRYAVAVERRPELVTIERHVLDTQAMEIATLRHEAREFCERSLPEARRIRLLFSNLGPDFHTAEQLATCASARLAR